MQKATQSGRVFRVCEVAACVGVGVCFLAAGVVLGEASDAVLLHKPFLWVLRIYTP